MYQDTNLSRTLFLKWLQGLFRIQNASALDSGVGIHVNAEPEFSGENYDAWAK